MGRGGVHPDKRKAAKPPSKVLRQFNRNHFFPSEYKELMASGGLSSGGWGQSQCCRYREEGQHDRFSKHSTWEQGVGRALGKFPESTPAEGFWYHCLQGNSKYLPSFLFYETELDPCFVAKGTSSLSLVFTKDSRYSIQRSQRPSFFFQEFQASMQRSSVMYKIWVNPAVLFLVHCLIILSF